MVSSFLSDQTQCIFVGDVLSKCSAITCGVPQGSVLEQLLFIIYINDIAAVSSKLSFVLYAHDTNLFASHKSLDNLIKLFYEELDKVAKWLKMNNLSLSVKKTNFMVFPNRQKLMDTEINIKINNSSIDPVS